MASTARPRCYRTEALAAGMPVISTKGAPLSGLEREDCGWWIDHRADPLAAVLAQAMALPVETVQRVTEIIKS